MSEDKNSNTSATKVYSSSSEDALKTASYGAQTDSRTDRTTAHNLGAGDTVQLAGGEYRIGSIISGEKKTGEAVIYLIRDNAGNDFALKLYYPFRDARDEPNSEALKRIKAIDNPDILKLHHFGTGAEKFNGQFCYEICDFAKGGDLLKVENVKEKYTPEFIERHVIREIFKGIQILHENRIYHCDLKPQNVFYRDEQQTDLVIGDYGSAKTFTQSSEKELSYMSVVKGTDFYLAPEQAIGIISEKNDYYSFGMIILHLLYPEKIDQQTLGKIYERRAAEKPIIDYDAKYKRLNDLIAGLTLQDIQQRWGQKEVSQWLAGKSVAVQYKKAAAPSVMPIRVGSVTIQTEEDLVAYAEKGEDWYRYLIEDKQGYHLLLTWISQVRDIESKQIFNLLMKAASVKGVRFAQEALFRYFMPGRPVRVMTDMDINNSGNPDAVTKEFVDQLEDRWKTTKIADMSWYLFCFGMALEQFVMNASGNAQQAGSAILKRFLKCFPQKQARSLETEILLQKRKEKLPAKSKDRPEVWELVSREITDEGLAELFHEFNPDRLFRDIAGNPVASLEDIGLLFAANPKLWKDRFLRAERSAYFKKTNLTHLAGLDRDAFLFKVFEAHLMLDVEISDMKRLVLPPAKNTEPVPSDGIEFEYRITRTANPFLEENNIRGFLQETIEEDRIVIKPFTDKPAGDVCSAFLLTLEKKFSLPSGKWTSHSVKTLQDKFTDKQNEIKEAAAAEKKKQARSDIGYAVKSFFFLIPPVFLYFIFLAFHEKNIAVIDFISQFTPFTMSFEHAYWEDELNYETGASLLIFFVIAVLPSALLTMKKATASEIIYPSLIGLVFPGIFFTSMMPLPSMMFMLTVIPMIIYSTRKNRLRPVPFIVSLVPALLLVFAGDYFFKDTPPSSKISRPQNYSAKIKKQVSLRTATSGQSAILATAGTDTVIVVTGDKNWSLIRYKNLEGYVPSDALMRLPVMEGIVHKRNPYLMSAPGYDSETVETVPRGTRVEVLAVENEWYLVRVRKIIEGYLHVKDVQVKEVLIRPANPFTDPRDGKTYKTVKIGDQVWMAKNLNYDAGKGSWCYKNNRSHCAKFGRLYDWETVQRIAPPGWRLPSKDEFETLVIYLGGAETGAYGRIISGEPDGFNVLFGGHRSPYSDHFESDYYGSMDKEADFWSSTESDKGAWRLNVNSVDKTVIVTTFPKEYALSVRLIRD